MNGQEKREKVMKGMDTFLGDKCSMFTCDCYILDCPYAGSDCMIEMIRDAYEVLKAQEPRVLTLDEALNSLVIEYRSGKLREVGKLIFKEGYEYYGNLWRVWDKMPTDEQREATPWNAQK